MSEETVQQIGEVIDDLDKLRTKLKKIQIEASRKLVRQESTL